MSLQRSHTRSGRVQQMMQLLTICAISSMKADVKGCAALVHQKGNFGGLSPSIHWTRTQNSLTVHILHEATVSKQGHARQLQTVVSQIRKCSLEDPKLQPTIEVMIHGFRRRILYFKIPPRTPCSTTMKYPIKQGICPALQLIDRAFDPFTQRAGHMPGHMPSGVASATARNTTLRISASWR